LKASYGIESVTADLLRMSEAVGFADVLSEARTKEPFPFLFALQSLPQDSLDMLTDFVAVGAPLAYVYM
jgi:hypothetical protein